AYPEDPTKLDIPKEMLQNDVPHCTTLGVSQKEAAKHPGVDPQVQWSACQRRCWFSCGLADGNWLKTLNLTFENIPFRGSRPQTVWRGFHGQTFPADLGFICAAGRIWRPCERSSRYRV